MNPACCRVNIELVGIQIIVSKIDTGAIKYLVARYFKYLATSIWYKKYLVARYLFYQIVGRQVFDISNSWFPYIFKYMKYFVARYLNSLKYMKYLVAKYFNFCYEQILSMFWTGPILLGQTRHNKFNVHSSRQLKT